MKKYSKFMLTVSLLAAASIGMASAAPVTIRVTGSSAYRAAVTNAVLHLLDSSKGIQAVYANFSGNAPTSLAGANQQIIHGFLLNAVSGSGETSYPAGQEIYFKSSWSGSLSGLIALTTNANTAQPFLSTSNINTSDAGQTAAPGVGDNSSDGPTGGERASSPVYDAAQVADYAMSDVFASSTPYNNSNLVSAKTGLSGAANGGAPPGVVGVVPFTWVAGNDMVGSVTNINSIQAQQLLLGGMTLSQFTGVSSDSGTQVYAVGRDADSGTRFTAFAESGFALIGISNPDPTQYEVTVSNGVVSVDPYPAETLFGQNFNAGTQGYPSGGNLASALGTSGTLTANDNPGDVVGYLGESDAVNAIGLGAHVLSYNGVAYATPVSSTPPSLKFNRTLIDEGVYTFWGYEHEYYNKGNADAAIADALAKQVASTDAAVTGELLKNMHVSRGQEGGPIGHN